MNVAIPRGWQSESHRQTDMYWLRSTVSGNQNNNGKPADRLLAKYSFNLLADRS